MTRSKEHGRKPKCRGKKRGMKPKSKRNRKRPRGGVGILNGMAGSADEGMEDASSQVHVDILPLKIPCSQKDTKTVIGASGGKCSGMESNERIRAVRPYPFTFATFAKQRWLGRSILEVYLEEFGSYPKSYYEAAIKEGRIVVNGKKVECDYKIKGNDELAHVVHRHEPAVAICPAETAIEQGNTNANSVVNVGKPYIMVVHEDENIIVVDKPSTLPVHPCGGYNFNSMFHVLSEQDPSLKDNLFNVHRLDRLTSGLTIVAKNSNTARVLGKCIMDRNCDKVYLARVKGKFPLDAPTKDKLESVPLDGLTTPPCVFGEWSGCKNEAKNGTAATCYWINSANGEIKKDAALVDIFNNHVDVFNLNEEGTTKDSLWLNLSVPVEIIEPKNGVCKAGNGKPAQTSFAVVGYDNETDSTVVLAKPSTGRTHQIRLHLQYLGHPIANDPNYGGEIFFADTMGKDMCIVARQRMDEIDREADVDIVRPSNSTSTDTPATEQEIASAGVGEHNRNEGESLLDFVKRTCVWCNRAKGENRAVLEFLTRSKGIWLHALQYRMVGPDGILCFKTDIPSWSRVNSDWKIKIEK